MLVVGTWLVVEPIQMRVGHDAAEVAIAGSARCKGNQVERLLVGLPLFVAHPTTGNIRLNANDRLDPMSLRRLHKLNRAIESPVVGEGNGVHPEALRLLHQRFQVAHAVEQAELAVDVEVRKVSLGVHVGQSSDRRTIHLWMSRNAHGYAQQSRPPKGAPPSPPQPTRSCAACWRRAARLRSSAPPPAQTARHTASCAPSPRQAGTSFQ